MSGYLSSQGQPIHDNHWLGKMFMAAPMQIEKRYVDLAMTTSANHKYTDTRPGGNWAINNPPAYTRHADPRISGLNGRAAASVEAVGMGGFYSEQLDDTAHLVHFCFGVPSFKGMIAFFSGMGDLNAATYARHGRYPISFLFGKAVGLLVSLRFLPLILTATVLKYVFGRSSSKYYSLKPTMHAYWRRVDFICNNIAVATNLYQRPGLMQRFAEKQAEKDFASFADPSEDTKKYGLTDADIGELSKLAYQVAPEIFRKDGGVDVYYLANRAQAMAKARREKFKSLMEKYDGRNVSAKDIAKAVHDMEYTANITTRDVEYQHQTLSAMLEKVHSPIPGAKHPDGTNNAMSLAGEEFKEGDDAFNKAINGILASKDGSYKDTGIYSEPPSAQNVVITNPTAEQANAEAQQAQQQQQANQSDSVDVSHINDPNTISTSSAWNYIVTDGALNPQTNLPEPKLKRGWLASLWEYISNGYHGSYEWVTFRVAHTGSISSSFSNSSKQANITSMINGFSSMIADGRFTFSNGVTGIGPIDMAFRAAKDAALGFLSGFDLAGVISLGGSAYVDIPEHWESSSATFPSESFKMELRSEYANKLSRFINLYIPLSMVQAGSLPISTGRQQYTAPYYCKVISPGRMSTQLGMIDSLSIDIGVGNVGFNQSDMPLGFDVSFTVRDMNKVLHAPISDGYSILNPLKGIFDDDNAFNDYLNVISAVSMADQVLPLRRLSKNITLKLANVDSFFSVGNMSMMYYDSAPGRLAKSMVSAGAMVGIPGLSTPSFDRAFGLPGQLVGQR